MIPCTLVPYLCVSCCSLWWRRVDEVLGTNGVAAQRTGRLVTQDHLLYTPGWVGRVGAGRGRVGIYLSKRMQAVLETTGQ